MYMMTTQDECDQVTRLVTGTMCHSNHHLYQGLKAHDWNIVLITFPWIVVLAAFLAMVSLLVLSLIYDTLWKSKHGGGCRAIYPASKQAVEDTSRRDDTPGPGKAHIPKHIAVIMDGNRRYGRKKFGSGMKGHWEGGEVLVNFIDWCMEAGVEMVTAYAFSTENWKRPAAEVSTLMSIFDKYCADILPRALKKNIRIRILATDKERLPDNIQTHIEKMERETAHCTAFSLNLCISYGSRGELVMAAQDLATRCTRGELEPQDIDEETFGSALLTRGLKDPDLLLRTSGEVRLSNFLLFQLAYTELLFVNKCWPEITESDLRASIDEYSSRQRRYGK